MLDAGADPNREGVPSLPRFDLVRNQFGGRLSSVFVTHAHHDHIGALPTVVDGHPDADVFMTPATRALTQFMLFASARLQQRKFKEGTSDQPPLFDAEQVEDALDSFVSYDYGETIPVANGIEAEFLDAGHVLGSAGVLLRFQEDGKERTLFCTGDTNAHTQTIIPGATYPERPLDILIMESTLGADPEAEMTDRAREEDRFREALLSTLERGGSALVPVFMLGRAQEVLAMIHRFKNEGAIARDLPVYTAGGMRQIAETYDEWRLDSPRVDEEFIVRNVRQRFFPRKQNKILKTLREPSIFVLASGMMFENTMSNKLAQLIIEEEKHAILFVGYCKDDSPGGRLLEAARAGHKEIALDEKAGYQSIQCQVERFRFSGHSNRQHLVELARRLRPKTTVLVHGDTDARAWMASAVQSAVPTTKVVLPQFGKAISI